MRIKDRLKNIQGLRLNTKWGMCRLVQYYEEQHRLAVIFDEGVEYVVLCDNISFVHVGNGEDIALISVDDIVQNEG